MASVCFSYLPNKQVKFFGAFTVNSQRPKTVYKAWKLISTNVVLLINNKFIINPAHQELFLASQKESCKIDFIYILKKSTKILKSIISICKILK